MIKAICCVPVSPIRAEPSHRTEMVSQLLFGECCEVLEQVKDWSRIRVKYDGYEGWCQPAHLTEIDGDEFGAGCNKYMDITSFYHRKARGFDLYTAGQRYVSVMAGTFVAVVFEKEALYVGSLTFTDSRYPDVMCE